MRLSYLFMLLSIIACNGGGGGSGGGSSADAVSHLGIWYVCEDYDGDSNGTNDSSLGLVLSIAEGAVSLTGTNYTGINCPSGSEDYRYTNTGSYTRSGNNYSAILQSLTYTPLSASDVSYSNTNSWCGLTNWVINVPQSTLGRSCDGDISNAGDVDNFMVIRNGNFITSGDTTYELAIGTDLSPAGLTLPNGTYAYSDGDTFAALAILNSGSYSLYRYDLASKVYSLESGTYNSSNNVANFTVTGSSPVGCNTGSESRRFTTGSLGITMEFLENNLLIFAQKVSMTESQFRTAFLGGGFSVGCF